MKLRFYPYDFEYKFKDGKVLVYLYSKLEDNTKICVIHEHQPYFFAKLDNINLTELKKRIELLNIDNRPEPARVTSFETIEKELLGKPTKFLKIYTNYPKAVPLISKELQSWGIECFEKDILFIHRYLRDLNITPFTLVEAQGEFKSNTELRVPVFQATVITQYSKEHLQKPKILAVDLETYGVNREINPEKNPILMIGLYGFNEHGQEFQKVITWKHFPHQLNYLEITATEADMIERFRQIMLDYQPDILTGYYSDVFDLPYLQVRAQKFNIPLDLGLDRSELFTEKNLESRDGKSWIKGLLHLDIFKFVRNIIGKNLKIDSLSLDAVAEELIGHKKHVVNLDILADTWDNSPERLIEFCEYNLHDARLTAKLCATLYSDMIEFTKIIGLPTFDIIHMRFSKLVESYILKRAAEFNVIAPNRPDNTEIDQRMKESIEGAFVFEPTPGLYQDVAVFDFRSLYPTIITAHNIGPESFHCNCCSKTTMVPGKEEYWFCAKKKGFLPLVLEHLILLRVDLKRLIKEAKTKSEDTALLDARSYAIKTLANSFYGYLGFYGARWYCLECAASTTAYARNYIKQTIHKAEQKGFKVIYADTDSCFMLLGDQNISKAMEFMNEVNFDLPGHMELDFEGYYPRGLFVAAKGTEKGAKKKYALISDKGKLKITGFETVRRNSSQIAKEVQKEVLKLVLTGKTDEAIKYVRDQIKELQIGKIPNTKMILKTQITKELDSYASIGPHVAVARQLSERGERIVPGMVMEYIIVKGTGLLREKARIVADVKEGEYDPEYYLQNQILPAVSNIFAVLGYSEEDIFKESSQTGLGKFF